MSVSGDEQVQIPVVVEIGYGNTHAPTFDGKSRLLRDVGEFAIGVLAIKRDHQVAAAAVAVDT